ncbi:hypothetical protein D3C71_1644710 [compost metagenome]
MLRPPSPHCSIRRSASASASASPLARATSRSAFAWAVLFAARLPITSKPMAPSIWVSSCLSCTFLSSKIGAKPLALSKPVTPRCKPASAESSPLRISTVPSAKPLRVVELLLSPVGRPGTSDGSNEKPSEGLPPPLVPPLTDAERNSARFFSSSNDRLPVDS